MVKIRMEFLKKGKKKPNQYYSYGTVYVACKSKSLDLLLRAGLSARLNESYGLKL